MKPPLFAYCAPTTIDECVAALTADDRAVILAGCTIRAKCRPIRPSVQGRHVGLG
jgi:hypothetical protein